MRLPLAIAAAALILQVSEAGTDNHRYKEGDHIELWVNKVRKPFETMASRPQWSPAPPRSLHCHQKQISNHFVSIFRSGHMPILKRRMNIIHFPIVLQKQSIIQMKKAADLMNGRVTTWVKSLVGMHSVILGMILHF